MICVMALLMSVSFQSATAAEYAYKIGSGDLLKIVVHNNPDLSLDARVQENGDISYPLVGKVPVGGLTTSGAEKKIADMLESGGFVKRPQVNVLISQYQSKTVTVIGAVARPGRYSLERSTNLTDLLALVGGTTQSGSDIVTVIDKSGNKNYDLGAILGKGDNAQNVQLVGGEIVNIHSNDVSVLGFVNRPGKYAISGGVRTLADFLSVAGGIVHNDSNTGSGSDVVVLNTVRDGAPAHIEVDVAKALRSGSDEANIMISSGDVIYVPQASAIYIYGEVRNPGSFRMQPNMTVMQALAQGGGPTNRGTQRGIKLYRRNSDGSVVETSPKLTDNVQPSDVIYVNESLF